jgi:hypothetical protein
MTRNTVILWVGRLLTLAFTVAIVWDALGDGRISREIRMVTVGTVGVLFFVWGWWQVRIAWKYEGMPTIPLAFRWVMAVWLMSFFLFVAWVILVALFPEANSSLRSAFMWWQFGASTLWVFGRWVTVDEPHTAGVGETGASTTNGG